jgi:riboflavin kinase/FMN adenylyltransferase
LIIKSFKRRDGKSSSAEKILILQGCAAQAECGQKYNPPNPRFELRIHYGIDSFESDKKVVLTTGTFDGVHLGHKKILSRIVDLAKKLKGESVLLTFHPHPRLVLFPENSDLRLLNSQSEKLQLLEETGIDHIIVHPFTHDFSRLSSLEFVRDLLVNKVGIDLLVIGYNHHFGRNREGSFDSLCEFAEVFGFDVEEIPAHDLEKVNISSTKIRHALEEGDVELAGKFLGYPYFITGSVVQGSRVGREIGFPTANIQVNERFKLIPADGVYAVQVAWKEGFLSGMLNIGVRPTVDSQKRKSIEVHLLDFDEDIYGKELQVRFIKRIREERQFESLEALKQQLEIDQNRTRNIFMTR